MEIILFILFIAMLATLIYLVISAEKEFNAMIIFIFAVMFFIFSVVEYKMAYRNGQIDQINGKSKYVKQYIMQDSVVVDSVYVLREKKK